MNSVSMKVKSLNFELITIKFIQKCSGKFAKTLFQFEDRSTK